MQEEYNKSSDFHDLIDKKRIKSSCQVKKKVEERVIVLRVLWFI